MLVRGRDSNLIGWQVLGMPPRLTKLPIAYPTTIDFFTVANFRSFILRQSPKVCL